MRKLAHYAIGTIIAVCAAVFGFYLLALLLLFNFTLPVEGGIKLVLSLIFLAVLPVWVWVLVNKQTRTSDARLGWRWIALPVLPMLVQLSVPLYLFVTGRAS